MLRVGLTGGLGSGKSTVAAMLGELGAHVAQADELGRALMLPGQPVYEQIVDRFGHDVVAGDGSLDRNKLAQLAFAEGRLRELNAIVHPAVIAAQAEWMRQLCRRSPQAVAVVESALIFEVERDARARGEREGVLADWRRRFDRIVLVTAPDAMKIARYVERSIGSCGPDGQDPAVRRSDPARQTSPRASHDRQALERDAVARLAHQIPDSEKAAKSDFLIENKGDISALRREVEALWRMLRSESNKIAGFESLE